MNVAIGIAVYSLFIFIYGLIICEKCKKTKGFELLMSLLFWGFFIAVCYILGAII
jgi:hypothetical protein